MRRSAERFDAFGRANRQPGRHVQIVARSVETALHKLHELGFDLTRIESGWGVAPLPPVAADDLAGIGRTNDAILYGGEVTLWVRGDDASLDGARPSRTEQRLARPRRTVRQHLRPLRPRFL